MFFTQTKIDILVFVLLGAFICFVWWLEHKDIHCPTFDSTKEECDRYGGMSFSYTKPNDTDTCQELVNKIWKAAGAEQASVKWRKSLLLAVSIMVAFWLTVGVLGKMNPATSLPTWQTFILSVLVAYAVLLGSYMYYSYHVFGVAEVWIRDSLKEMEAKGCINKGTI